MGDRITQLIRIFDQLPDEQADALLKRLLKEDPVAAIRIIQRHFGFSDLVYADDMGIDELIENVPPVTLETALQGAGNALIKRFAVRFGTAKARTFIEDVDRGDAPAASVDAARRSVLVKAMILHRRGRLVMRRPGVDSA